MAMKVRELRGMRGARGAGFPRGRSPLRRESFLIFFGPPRVFPKGGPYRGSPKVPAPRMVLLRQKKKNNNFLHPFP